MVVLNTVWRLEDEAPRAPERERGPERVGRVITLSIDSLLASSSSVVDVRIRSKEGCETGDTKAR